MKVQDVSKQQGLQVLLHFDETPDRPVAKDSSLGRNDVIIGYFENGSWNSDGLPRGKDLIPSRVISTAPVQGGPLAARAPPHGRVFIEIRPGAMPFPPETLFSMVTDPKHGDLHPANTTATLFAPTVEDSRDSSNSHFWALQFWYLPGPR
eukprot:CAMPEP_0177618476 /NCGR_PEP_ID=MMETSP0419_2-20121207/25601_1 /TAXON_ID=582737 /ORGANISM="Tetraselmis sp., Strain GSL018" /LENGTH=149 /DNA_ID=CAMNT_0019117387 /DNA_START=324 /DNA_END=770 /DNA_ORIENTATION=-